MPSVQWQWTSTVGSVSVLAIGEVFGLSPETSGISLMMARELHLDRRQWQIWSGIKLKSPAGYKPLRRYLALLKGKGQAALSWTRSSFRSWAGTVLSMSSSPVRHHVCQRGIFFLNNISGFWMQYIVILHVAETLVLPQGCVYPPFATATSYLSKSLSSPAASSCLLCWSLYIS